MQHAAVCFFWFMGFMAMARLVTPRLVAGEWHERHVGEFVGMNADARVMRYFPSTLDRVWSFTALQNKPSERVMQKIGMERVKEFDHPALPEGHPLRRHVLYCASLLR